MPLPSVTKWSRVTQPLPSNDCFSGSIIIALSKYIAIISPFTKFHLHRLLNESNFMAEIGKTEKSLISESSVKFYELKTVSLRKQNACCMGYLKKINVK
jgi:hypothetical protein